MKYSLNEIAKKLEVMTSKPMHLGLKGGLMGIVLFFFYYKEFTEDTRYEESTIHLLEKILLRTSVNESFNYAYGIVGIANTLLFLIEENFMEVDTGTFFEDLDDIVLKKIKSEIVVNFSFETGMIGLCNYALNRPNKMEAIQITLNHLSCGFRNDKYDINPVFLFPSEILQDVKLFLSKISTMEEFSKSTSSLNQTIADFERNNIILQSNCPEYSILQQLREAGLPVIAKESPDIGLQGLAYMSMENPSLPPWWKLF